MNLKLKHAVARGQLADGDARRFRHPNLILSSRTGEQMGAWDCQKYQKDQIQRVGVMGRSIGICESDRASRHGQAMRDREQS